MTRSSAVSPGSILLWFVLGAVVGAMALSALIAHRCDLEGSALLFHSDNSIKCEVQRVTVSGKT